MSEISWICQGCGKAFIDSTYLYELKIPDMVECNRCGWKRKPKSAKTLQREKDMAEGNVRDKDGNIIFTGLKHRIQGAVIDLPATHKPRTNDCCPRICF